MSKEYKICKRCIMDTSDPEIKFDTSGVCNHCFIYDHAASTILFSKEEAKQRLLQIVKQIKKVGKKKQYDCIIGVSGGVDSTYVAYMVKDLGLRPLAVHLDNGWNSNLAVDNIQAILKKLEIDLYTYVLNWEEFKNIQTAFLKASTPDVEIPTDHAIMSVLYKIAAEKNVKYILNGYNLRTEAILPRRWSHGYHDAKYIKSILKQFDNMKINDFPFLTLMKLFYYKFIKRIVVTSPLNYIEFNKNSVTSFLKDCFSWKPYKEKHGESIYTMFVQNVLYPNKFGFDKRRAHLSTLVCSKQLSRNEAIKLINSPAINDIEKKDLIKYVSKKLAITDVEFFNIIKNKPKTFWDYKSYENNIVTNVLLRLISKGFPHLKDIRSYLQKKKMEN